MRVIQLTITLMDFSILCIALLSQSDLSVFLGLFGSAVSNFGVLLGMEKIWGKNQMTGKYL